MQDFREGQVEKKGAKTGKILNFQALRWGFSHLSLNGKDIVYLTILTRNTPSNLKIEPEN